VAEKSAAIGNEYAIIDGVKYVSSLPTCPASSPFCVSGLSSPAKLMMPDSAPLVSRKIPQQVEEDVFEERSAHTPVASKPSRERMIAQ